VWTDLDPTTLVIEELGLEYPDLISHVMFHGQTVESRIGETREMLNLRLILRRPEHSLIGRTGMSDEFAYEETTQLLAGVYDDERVKKIVPRAAELLSTPTAYGPRVRDQLLAVEAELLANPNSRRAVVYVGRHDDLASLSDPDEAIRRKAEMPCTALWQFHLRHDVLSMSVYMRSWDLVWGLSYDVPGFTAIQRALAASLGVVVGNYTHTSGSAHIYDRHYHAENWPRDDSWFAIDHLFGESLLETRFNALKALNPEEV
jgi:Thymidylate synthase